MYSYERQADLITEEEKGIGPHCWILLMKMLEIEKKFFLSVYLGIVRPAVERHKFKKRLNCVVPDYKIAEAYKAKCGKITFT